MFCWPNCFWTCDGSEHDGRATFLTSLAGTKRREEGTRVRSPLWGHMTNDLKTSPTWKIFHHLPMVPPREASLHHMDFWETLKIQIIATSVMIFWSCLGSIKGENELPTAMGSGKREKAWTQPWCQPEHVEIYDQGVGGIRIGDY